MPGEPGPKTYVLLFDVETKTARTLNVNAFKDQSNEVALRNYTQDDLYKDFRSNVWEGDNNNFYMTRISRDQYRVDICRYDIAQDSLYVLVKERLNTYIDVADYEVIKETLISAFKRRFKPEFVNRIDVTTVFHPLEYQHLSQIAKLFICNLNKRLLAQQNTSLKMTESALNYLIEKGYDREYGARPLRRLIEQEIEDRLAEQFLEGSIPHGSVITISAKEGKLTFRVYRKENN